MEQQRRNSFVIAENEAKCKVQETLDKDDSRSDQTNLNHHEY